MMGNISIYAGSVPSVAYMPPYAIRGHRCRLDVGEAYRYIQGKGATAFR